LKLVVLSLIFSVIYGSSITALSDIFNSIGFNELNIDVPTGNSKEVTTFKGYIIRQSLGTTDTRNNLFFTILYDFFKSKYVLASYDLKGNNKTYTLPPFARTVFLGSGQILSYDPNTGNLWMGYFESESQQVVGSYNVVTQSFTKLATIDSDVTLIWPSSSFDWKKKVLVAQYAYSDIYTIGFDTTSGKVLFNASFEELPFVSFDYDPNSSLLYGYLYDYGSLRYNLASVDPVSGKVVSKTQQSVLGFFTNSVVDVKNNQLIGLILVSHTTTSAPEKPPMLLKKTDRFPNTLIISCRNSHVVFCDPQCHHEQLIRNPSNDSDPFNLIAFDLLTSKAASNVTFCLFPLPDNSTLNSCPLTIARPIAF